MKWSKADVERFQSGYSQLKNFTVDSVEGNILIYSYTDKNKVRWKWKARLLKGGPFLSFTVHFVDDNGDLFQ